MDIFKSLYRQVFSVTPESYEALALRLFQFQYAHNPVYGAYVDYLGVAPQRITEMADIPFLPIELFKRHRVVTGSWKEECVFESSGTTGAVTSKHFVYDPRFYLQNCRLLFEKTYGESADYTVLALLPSYLERSGSSLVCMAEDFINRSADKRSGFFLHNTTELVSLLTELVKEGKKTLLLGVTFGLLALADKYRLYLKNVVVMETGGMKGRREEMLRTQVHKILQNAFGVDRVHSEYGMTELFSQAYAKGGGIFKPAGPLRVLMRDINDPLTISNELRSGGLNLIDLANVHSCCFIETGDLGKVHANGSFEVLGRLDHSDIRGCNLMLA